MIRIVLASLLVLSIVFSGATADTFTDRLGQVKPPVDFDLGFDTRIRQVTLHNVLDFDTESEASGGATALESSFFRVRHRVWTRLKFNFGCSLYGRATTEWRKYYDADFDPVTGEPTDYNYQGPKKTEIVWDNLYLDIDKLPYVPLSLRVGRQDIIRGEGFVLLDGGPLDGSRTIYQNAVLLGIKGNELGWKNSNIDLFAIRNLARDRHVMTNDHEKALTEKDETAFGIYLKSKDPLLSNESESYYIYKSETNGDKAAFDQFSSVSATPARKPNTRIHTIGQRLQGELPWKTNFTIEGALQTGSIHHPTTRDKIADHKAYGGYLHFTKSVFMMLKPELKAGCILLSGDKQNTLEQEGWNPIFSRWPKWSELYIYSLLSGNDERRIAYWQNIMIFHAGINMTLSKNLSLRYSYNYMKAPQDRFGSGNKRGTLHTWKLSAKLSSSVDSHFLLESFHAGDFYLDPETDYKKDVAHFIRWELSIKK